MLCPQFLQKSNESYFQKAGFLRGSLRKSVNINFTMNISQR